MLLNARSIALTDPGVGGTAGIYLAGLLERMGIAETIRPKVQWQKNGFFTAQAVANGEAELGMTQVSEIVAVRGAVNAGPLPEPLQTVTTYCAGVFAASKAQTKRAPSSTGCSARRLSQMETGRLRSAIAAAVAAKEKGRRKRRPLTPPRIASLSTARRNGSFTPTRTTATKSCRTKSCGSESLVKLGILRRLSVR
jgi:hypothetical protein